MPPKEKQLFEEATAIKDAVERSRYLKAACSEDHVLRQRVEKLLDAADSAGRFMEKRAADSFEFTTELELPERVGQTIGRYKLLEKIGEGGFGYVFMAEQIQPVVRKVALKIIKPGMDTKQVIARFEAERQALALMDHPNIGSILDAGATENGRPYFVMELVRGIPITEYCRHRKLSTKERLELFTAVCAAIEHAHQKGVIHRDIKPTNILVYNNGERAIPKVIEFGIAKATQGRLTDKTLFTQFHQFIGTPSYMSPEQAQMSGVDVDTRSDIYSLGVLLYELLTGKTPLDLKNLNVQAYQETCRRVREDIAPKPSRRVSTLTHDELTSLADSQRTTTTEITTRLRGDLDWIVMKALEKDRSRRYKSTDALVMDIRRHLNYEPVSAGPPSVIYYVRKFLQRHRVAVATGFVFATVLLLGTIVSVAGWSQAVAIKEELAEQVTTTKHALSESNRLRIQSHHTSEELSRRIYLMHLANADRALLANNYLRAHTELDNCPAEHRSWEWQFLANRVSDFFPAVSPGIESPILSADGRRLIVIGGQGSARQQTICISDTSAGELIKSIPCEFVLNRLAMSRDEQLLAGGGNGPQIVFDLDTGEKLWSRNEHDKRFHGMEFSPDGRFLVSVNGDRSGLVVADARTGDKTGDKQIMIPLDMAVRGLTFSSDGRWLFVGGWNKTEPPLIIDFDKKRVAKHFPQGQTLIALHPNEDEIATGSTDGKITIWKWNDGELDVLREWQVSTEKVVAINYSADGTRLVSGDESNYVKVSDANTGHELAALNVKDTPWSVMLDPSHPGQVAFCTISEGLRLWRYEAREEGVIVKPLEANAIARFSPSGDRVVVSYKPKWGRGNGSMSVLDAESGQPVGAKEIDAPLHTGSWIDNRRVLAGVNSEREIRVYDSVSGDFEVTFKCLSNSAIVDVAASGDRLVAAFNDGTIGSWNLEAANEAGSSFGNLSRLHSLYGVAISDDTTQVAIAFFDEHTVEIWDVPGHKMSRRLAVPGQNPESIVFSKDAKSIYVGGNGGRLTRLEIATNRETKRYIGHTSEVVAVALSHHEDQVVSGDNSGRVIVWDAEYAEPLITLTAEGQPIRSLDLSADGKRIVVGREDGTVQIWTLPRSRWFSTAAYNATLHGQRAQRPVPMHRAVTDGQ